MATIEPDREARRHDTGPSSGRSDPVPEPVDWALGVSCSVAGLLLAGVGTWLYTRPGRAAFVSLLEAGGVDTTGLTTRAAVEAAGSSLDLLATVTVLTGSALVAGAALFVRARRRTRRRVDREGGSTVTFWAAAVYGAAVTVLVPFSVSTVGGGTAASLHDGADTRVGAAAGLVGAAVLSPLLVFGGLAVFTLAGALGTLADHHTVAGVVAVAGLLFVTAANVSLGALGGYVTGRLA